MATLTWTSPRDFGPQGRKAKKLSMKKGATGVQVPPVNDSNLESSELDQGLPYITQNLALQKRGTPKALSISPQRTKAKQTLECPLMKTPCTANLP